MRQVVGTLMIGVMSDGVFASQVEMSSSSEDECYCSAAGALTELKSGWKASVNEGNEYTSDPNLTSDDSRSPSKCGSKSAKVKRKHKKSARNVDRAPDLDTSATSDASVRCVAVSQGQEASENTAEQSPAGRGRMRGSAARGRPPRGKPSRGKGARGRRSRVRSQAAPGLPTVNIGYSDSEESNQPLFSKSSTQSKEIDDIIDLDSSGIDNSLNEKNSDADSENEEYSVKVHWRSREYHKFKIRKHQKISSIFEFFANAEKVDMDNLLLTLGDRVLRPVDTPASIQYNISQFIDGGITSHSVARIAEESAKKYDSYDGLAADVSDKLTIKLRSKEMKNPFQTTVGKNQKMSSVMIKFAQESEVPLERLKFFFDGDLVDGESTPASLELEGGECLDVHIL